MSIVIWYCDIQLDDTVSKYRYLKKKKKSKIHGMFVLSSYAEHKIAVFISKLKQWQEILASGLALLPVMEDERIVPALVSVYKAEAWHHLGFSGNLGSAACRAPYEKPSRWAVVTLRGCSFLSCWGHFVQLGRCTLIPPPLTLYKMWFNNVEYYRDWLLQMQIPMCSG